MLVSPNGSAVFDRSCDSVFRSDLFVGMFVLLVGILVREVLRGHVVRRGYASDWVCLRPEAEACGLKLKEWLSQKKVTAYDMHPVFRCRWLR
jgi:hypothetical protein